MSLQTLERFKLLNRGIILRTALRFFKISNHTMDNVTKKRKGGKSNLSGFLVTYCINMLFSFMAICTNVSSKKINKLFFFSISSR